MGIVIRDAETDAWRQVRIAVLPNERALPVAEMRAMATPETRYVIAELDGELAGAGLAGRSSFDYAGIHPRVLPGSRRCGVGTALLQYLADHAIATGFTEAGTLVDDEGSMAFAERFGFREVDRQIEQVRTIGNEPTPEIPGGAEHGLREVYTWTQIGNADMRALNERLGYIERGVSITVRGSLPLRHP